MPTLPPADLDRWRTLYLASDRATPFQSPAWLDPLYERHTRGLAAPLFFDDGFAPLIRRKRDLRLAGADYEDILCPSGCEAEAVRALLAELSKRGGWRSIYFRALRSDGALLTGWKEAAPTDLAWRILPHRVHAVVNLPTTWAEYEGQIGKKLAYKLRAAPGRRERSFASHELRRSRAETIKEDVDALFVLHQARWQARGEPGVFVTEADRDAFRIAARNLLAEGGLWLYTLWLDGEPASALCCLVDRRAVYYYIGGIDTRFQKHHPGKVLIGQAIRDAIEAGLEQFDFLGGAEGYKDDWANGGETVYRLIAGRGLTGAATVRISASILEWLRKRKEAPRAKPEPAGTLDE